MNGNFYKAALLALALALFGIALYVFRPTTNKLTRVTVSGDSQTRVAPDTAVVRFSVVTQNSQALGAQQENARKSETVKTAIESVTKNIKTEIKTSDYSLNPEQDYYSGKMPKILGYQAKNTVTVSISDLSQIGAVIDAATGAGANSIDGISFVLREDSPAQGDALALATKQALAKAESIAQSLNGKIVRIVESSEAGLQPTGSAANEYATMSANTNAMAMSRTIYNTPVQAGSLNVRSQVVLVVEIEVGG